MNTKTFIIIAVLIALSCYQAGILSKFLWDHHYGAVPMITPSEIMHVLKES